MHACDNRASEIIVFYRNCKNQISERSSEIVQVKVEIE